MQPHLKKIPDLQGDLFTCWKQGAIINLLNPLIILFFLSVLPHYVSTDDPNSRTQLLFLGSWVAFSASIVNSCYAVLFGTFGNYLMKFPNALLYIQKATGLLLIVLGIINLVWGSHRIVEREGWKTGFAWHLIEFIFWWFSVSQFTFQVSRFPNP